MLLSLQTNTQTYKTSSSLGVCNPPSVLILYSPSWLVLVPSYVQSLDHVDRSYWGGPFEPLVSPLKFQHLWMISGSPFFADPQRIPNIFSVNRRHLCWIRQDVHQLIRQSEAAWSAGIPSDSGCKTWQNTMVLGNKEPFHLNLMSFVIVPPFFI